MYRQIMAAGIAVCLGHMTALAQFQAPPNSQALDETGTLEEMQGPLVLMRDSKNETWLLRIGPDTKVSVTGDAEPEVLHSGIFVELAVEIDDKGALAKPVSAIEIISDPGKEGTGFFAAAEEGEEEPDEDARPIRKPEAGNYRVRGKLVSFRNDKIIVVAGRHVEGTVADDLKVTVNVTDPSVAQYGDEVATKAWFYNPYRPQPARGIPGQALAEEISIKLAKPLAPAEQGRKRASRRAARTDDE